ncbi:MAG: rod-binding protein [Deltaproteobacteria bacterium]|nr:rod-binding protein [Deltaproteobacteria bacterium]MBW1737243.1 rod-binding protein [Deltaproteobacteria bacterium]MBW1908143.1 rod-binding protein [Deltaproteobacteria bacterium]MBW2032222.1 rod-binding protein [Deltaproteobacteria bacterium]MBW2113796.1 rod-binding protein [Deltaproteobacteria bacterium]
MMPDMMSVPIIPWQNINVTSKIEMVRNTLESEKASSSVRSDRQLEEACSELESLFIYYLLKEMRATIPKSGFIDGGNAEEIYTSMLDSQLAKDISSKGGIGLSSLLRDQLSRMQGHTKNQGDYSRSQAEGVYHVQPFTNSHQSST